MGRLQLLQLDSVPVVIRTQYMPLFSRLGTYRAELLDEIAYDAGEWFEAWSHEASLLPVEMEPWLRWSKQRAREGETWKHLYALAQKDPGYIESVLSEVKARGGPSLRGICPILVHDRGTGGAVDRAAPLPSTGSIESARWAFGEAGAS